MPVEKVSKGKQLMRVKMNNEFQLVATLDSPPMAIFRHSFALQ